MKKLVALVCVLALTATVVGCGGSSSATITKKVETTEKTK